MADYHPVRPQLWEEPWFRALDRSAQVGYFYIATCEHRNTEGLFRLPMQYVTHDLAFMGPEVETSFATLKSAGIIDYDDAAVVVLDRKALTFNPPAGPKQIAGAVRKVRKVPDTPLKLELFTLAVEHAPEFGAALEREFPHLAAAARDPLDSEMTRLLADVP